ncbi:MAG: hypothetical protein QM692_06645 [Thermomicrobiales bacterium]
MAAPRVRVLVALAVALVALTSWWLWLQVHRQPTLTFVVPDGVSDYLITRWECPGGAALARNAVGGVQDQVVTFSAQGTACIAEAIPSGGYRVADFQDGGGAVLPVIVGGTRSVQGDAASGDAEYVFSLASLGIGESGQLGDECSLRAFLEREFGVPVRGVRCDPIWVLPNPVIPATPELPAAS